MKNRGDIINLQEYREPDLSRIRAIPTCLPVPHMATVICFQTAKNQRRRTA